MLFSGASDLLSQIVKPLVNSSTDFSPLVNSFQRLHFCAHLLDSPQLSFDLSLLLSTPFNSCWLISPQFHLPNFFSAQSKWHSCKLSCSGLSIRSCFQHSTVLSFSCHVLSFNPTGLLTVTCGSNVQTCLGRSIFSTCAKICDVTSSHLSRARVSSTAARGFESCCLKGETNKDTQAAQLRAPPECSEAWQTQAAQPCALLPCFFLLDWVAKHKRITHNGNTNWNSKTGSRSPRTKTIWQALFERNFFKSPKAVLFESLPKIAEKP